MPQALSPLCDVVACGRPTAGSYIDAVRARSAQFAVCAEHLSRLQAGQRPAVVTEGVDVAGRDGHPALLFPPTPGDRC